MRELDRFLNDHEVTTRRFFLQAGLTGTALSLLPSTGYSAESAPELKKAIAELDSLLTPPAEFRDVSRGKPIPHTLPEERLKEVGLTRETWRLEVLPDSESPARMRRPMTKEAGTALDFATLMQIAEKHSVKFLKAMTCLNIGCPLGTGIWEGVPLREVIWRTQPTENLRRVFYQGFHNDDPKQLFRSSLPIGRVLEDPFDLPPVILCYKLNGQWLSPQRGGPVRLIVPEAYGFKSVKWLTQVVLTNAPHSNDTYADGNNDIDSPLKSFAATLSVPKEAAAGQPIPVTGYAQVGISGVSRVQVLILPRNQEPPADDPHFMTAAWTDATILPPPEDWGGALPEQKLPLPVQRFTEDGRPEVWPLRLSRLHWAILHPALPPGDYTLRSRTIDEKGHAQPMPRPFRKSGHAAIETVNLTVR